MRLLFPALLLVCERARLVRGIAETLYEWNFYDAPPHSSIVDVVSNAQAVFVGGAMIDPYFGLRLNQTSPRHAFDAVFNGYALLSNIAFGGALTIELSIHLATLTQDQDIFACGTDDMWYQIRHATCCGMRVDVHGSVEHGAGRAAFETVYENHGSPRHQHIVVTYDGTTLNLYVNGKRDVKQWFHERLLNTSAIATSCYIGSDFVRKGTSGIHSGGLIKYLKIYRGAMGTAEVSSALIGSRSSAPSSAPSTAPTAAPSDAPTAFVHAAATLVVNPVVAADRWFGGMFLALALLLLACCPACIVKTILTIVYGVKYNRWSELKHHTIMAHRSGQASVQVEGVTRRGSLLDMLPGGRGEGRRRSSIAEWGRRLSARFSQGFAKTQAVELTDATFFATTEVHDASDLFDESAVVGKDPWADATEETRALPEFIATGAQFERFVWTILPSTTLVAALIGEEKSESFDTEGIGALSTEAIVNALTAHAAGMVDDDARDALEGILLEDVESFSCVTHQEFEVCLMRAMREDPDGGVAHWILKELLEEAEEWGYHHDESHDPPAPYYHCDSSGATEWEKPAILVAMERLHHLQIINAARDVES